MYNIPIYLSYFHSLPLKLVPVALSQIFLSFYSECWLVYSEYFGFPHVHWVSHCFSPPVHVESDCNSWPKGVLSLCSLQSNHSAQWTIPHLINQTISFQWTVNFLQVDYMFMLTRHLEQKAVVRPCLTSLILLWHTFPVPCILATYLQLQITVQVGKGEIILFPFYYI